MKKLLGAAILGFGATGCLGPNHLFNTLHNWNAEETDMDWANELIYIGMNIVPVYGVGLFIDQVFLNTIDYWSGDNPMSDPGPFPNDSFTN